MEGREEEDEEEMTETKQTLSLSFDYDVFSYVVLDSKHFAVTAPFSEEYTPGHELLVRYNEGRPPLAGTIEQVETDISEDGRFCHLIVATEWFGPMLAAERTKHLWTSA